MVESQEIEGHEPEGICRQRGSQVRYWYLKSVESGPGLETSKPDNLSTKHESGSGSHTGQDGGQPKVPVGMQIALLCGPSAQRTSRKA